MEARTYLTRPDTLAQQFSQEYSRSTFVDGVMVEDVGTFEQTQTMLASGAKTEIQLGDEELLIRHLHKMVERYLNT